MMQNGVTLAIVLDALLLSLGLVGVLLGCRILGSPGREQRVSRGLAVQRCPSASKNMKWHRLPQVSFPRFQAQFSLVVSFRVFPLFVRYFIVFNVIDGLLQYFLDPTLSPLYHHRLHGLACVYHLFHQCLLPCNSPLHLLRLDLSCMSLWSLARFVLAVEIVVMAGVGIEGRGVYGFRSPRAIFYWLVLSLFPKSWTSMSAWQRGSVARRTDTPLATV